MRMVRSWDPEHSTSGTWDFMGFWGFLGGATNMSRFGGLQKQASDSHSAADWGEDTV